MAFRSTSVSSSKSQTTPQFVGSTPFRAGWMENAGQQATNAALRNLASPLNANFEKHLGTIPEGPTFEPIDANRPFSQIPSNEIFQHAMAQSQAAAQNRGFELQKQWQGPQQYLQPDLKGLDAIGFAGGQAAGLEAQLGYDTAASKYFTDLLGRQTDRFGLESQQYLGRINAATDLSRIGEQFKASLAGPLFNFLKPQPFSKSSAGSASVAQST